MTATPRSPLFRPSASRSFGAALAAFVLAVFAVLAGGAAPASAHDVLLSTDPADGSVLTEAPAQLTLTFSADLTTGEGATAVQVTDGAGTAVPLDAPIVEGPTVTQPLPADLANGAYTVQWRVLSSDTHPISGEFAFTVDAPAPVETAEPEPTETAEPEPTETPEVTAVPAAPDASDSEEAGGFPLWVVFAILGILVAAALLYLGVSRARRNQAEQHLRDEDRNTTSGTGSER